MSAEALKLQETLTKASLPTLSSGSPHKKRDWLNELWGGLAAMLVALPSSIAFGILVYAPMGPGASGVGAMAGLLGACALGLITPFIGQTRGLISAPCAPAAAVLSALVASMNLGAGPSGDGVMTLVVFFSSVLQIGFGSLGGGNLIKFIPYQVVSGYLSGVGLLIAISQCPKLLGLPKEVSFWKGLFHPIHWRWPGVVVGLTTMVIMILAPKMSKKIPAPILALSSGVLVYFILALFFKELLIVEGNPLIIGALKVEGSFFENLKNQFSLISQIDHSMVQQALIPAITLSALLSIDTLKTCVAIDSLTRSRHDSNRELMGQGLGNLICALIGGLPGAGTMGATVVNVSSGGRTPWAGIFEGFFVLLALLFLGPMLTWIPVAALAGILLVVAFRMFDRSIFRLVFSSAGRFDFAVIVSVILVALSFDLIAASAVGIIFAIILFVRDQIRESVILQKTTLCTLSSKTRRQGLESEILQKFGHQALICKLQGNLFFGTTDQLSRCLETDLKQSLFLLFDMRRVHSLDYTAVHLLEQIHMQLAERDGHLLFSGMPSQLYEKRDFERYLSQMGLVDRGNNVLIFQTFDSALEWMEERILSLQGVVHSESDRPLELKEFSLFWGITPKELRVLESSMNLLKIKKGEHIVRQGDLGDELFLVRKGSFRALLQLPGGKSHHIATFEQGSFFGELAFLDHDRRSANIEAKVESEVFVLSRARFNEQSISAPEVGAQFFARLASAIAQRLRMADSELRVLEDR